MLYSETPSGQNQELGVCLFVRLFLAMSEFKAGVSEITHPRTPAHQLTSYSQTKHQGLPAPGLVPGRSSIISGDPIFFPLKRPSAVSPPLYLFPA